MNDQQFFLANAYLDGELTDDERALAESDPIVMAGVDELRALQDEVRDVEPPTTAARESAIAAAMSVYTAEAVSASTAVPAASPRARGPRPRVVVPFWRRPPTRRALAFAAAVVAVGAMGVVVVDLVDRGDRGDLDSADTASDAGDASRLTEAYGQDDGGDTADAADVAAAELAPSAVSDDDAGDEVLDAAGGEADVAEDATAAGDDSVDVSADDLGAGVVPVTEADEPLPEGQLPSSDELGELGADLLAERRAGTLPPSPNTTCVFVDRPAEILAQSSFATASGRTDLLVAVDETNGVVYAIDPVTCTIVVDTPLG